jgi:SUMO ligase MMS21 Smc5/6 complex component
MSLSICSITGQPLSQPMASLKTGHLFEREVIVKHLNSFPYCPITN